MSHQIVPLSCLIYTKLAEHLYVKLHIVLCISVELLSSNVLLCRILSCLMEHLYTEKMVEDCEHRLLELQYFIARDWK